MIAARRRKLHARRVRSPEKGVKVQGERLSECFVCVLTVSLRRIG